MDNQQLIDKAIKTSAHNWHEIAPLLEMTEDKETRNRLNNIMISKYHEDEFHSRLL